MPASTDIESFGRHYLLRSYQNVTKKRHYTIANSMKRSAYDQYLAIINQAKSSNDTVNGSVRFDESVLPENQTETEIVFTCKNYNRDGGLSQRLHSSENELC